MIQVVLKGLMIEVVLKILMIQVVLKVLNAIFSWGSRTNCTFETSSLEVLRIMNYIVAGIVGRVLTR